MSERHLRLVEELPVRRRRFDWVVLWSYVGLGLFSVAFWTFVVWLFIR